MTDELQNSETIKNRVMKYLKIGLLIYLSIFTIVFISLVLSGDTDLTLYFIDSRTDGIYNSGVLNFQIIITLFLALVS